MVKFACRVTSTGYCLLSIVDDEPDIVMLPHRLRLVGTE